jgi:DNA processing protein
VEESSPKDDLAYLHALGRVKGLGPIKIRNLISHYPKLEDIFEAPRLESSVPSLKPQLIVGIRDQGKHLAESKSFVEMQLEIARSLRASLLALTDPRYPKILIDSGVAPEILFALGDIKRLRALQKGSVAIVGTRRATVEGEKLARRIAEHFADLGWTIVSGLARGIDVAAHVGSLDSDGPTLAVVGSGVDVIYPRETAQVRDRIASRGLVASEYPFGVRPMAVNLKRRNKLIVGFSRAVIVVQTKVGGGTYNAVRAAKEQKKPVFALQPKSGQSGFEGNVDIVRAMKAIPISQEIDASALAERISSEKTALL